jgi:hypothetical protein
MHSGVVPGLRAKISGRFREQQRVVLEARNGKSSHFEIQKASVDFAAVFRYPTRGMWRYRNLHIQCQGSVKAIQYLRRYNHWLHGQSPCGTSLCVKIVSVNDVMQADFHRTRTPHVVAFQGVMRAKILLGNSPVNQLSSNNETFAECHQNVSCQGCFIPSSGGLLLWLSK